MSSFDVVATPYSAAYVVLRRGDTAAFVKRSNTAWMDGFYGTTAGKIDKGESATQAAVREAKEEAGVDIKAEDLRHLITIHRLGDDGTLWIDFYFEATEWHGEPFNAEPHMHSELTWIDFKNLPENVVPSNKFAIEQAAKGLTYTEYGW